METLKKVFSKEFIRGLFRRKYKVKNRKVTKARKLYLYIVFSSVAGLMYFFSALYFGLPKHWSFTPVYLLVVSVLFNFIKKNWRLWSIFLVDMEQGRLLMYLNDYTTWSEEHKLRVIKWVYLRPNRVRLETFQEIQNNILNNQEEPEDRKRLLRCKPVACPQQIKDGHNEAFLVNALIYAHINIQVLDDDLRELMKLTDDNIMAFDLDREIDKMRADKYKKYIEVGKKHSKRLNGEV